MTAVLSSEVTLPVFDHEDLDLRDRDRVRRHDNLRHRRQLKSERRPQAEEARIERQSKRRGYSGKRFHQRWFSIMRADKFDGCKAPKWVIDLTERDFLALTRPLPVLVIREVHRHGQEPEMTYYEVDPDEVVDFVADLLEDASDEDFVRTTFDTFDFSAVFEL